VLAVRARRVTNTNRRWQHCKICFSWKCGDRRCQRNCPGSGTVCYVLLQTKYSYLVVEFTVNGKGTVVPIHAMKARGGSRGVAPLKYLGTRWRCVVNTHLGLWSTHTSAALTLGEELRYSFNRTLCGLQSRSGCYGEETHLFGSTRPRTPDRPARSLVTILKSYHSSRE